MEKGLVRRELIEEPNLDLFEYDDGGAPSLGGIATSVIEKSKKTRGPATKELLGRPEAFNPCCDHCSMFARFGEVIKARGDLSVLVAPA